MLAWPLLTLLMAPPDAPPRPPALPPPSGAHAEVQPADASARPGEHTREWKPAGDLVQVPFPLERTQRGNDDPRYRAPIVDLRDPFVHGRPGRPLPAEVRRQLLPDLKDPFIAPRHPRPRGWKVALPGDIRDPFAERNWNRNGCGGQADETRDGVVIQRPTGGDARPEPKACNRIVRPLPADLLDPFRPR